MHYGSPGTRVGLERLALVGRRGWQERHARHKALGY